MDWDNDFTLKFLKVYQCEPMIWNPNHCQYKNKVKVHNAWTRIATRFNKTVAELKAKKNSLMASYRSCKRRRQASLRAAAEEDDAYEPTWFAYSYMDSFLGPVYDSKVNQLGEDTSTNNFPQPMEQIPVKSELQSASEPSDTEEQEYLEIREEEEPRPLKPHVRRPHVMPMARRRLQRRQQNDIDIYKKMSETLANLTKLFSNRNEEDECDLYGKLIASRLRRCAYIERLQLMYEIDGLMLKRLMDCTPRPQDPIDPTDSAACDEIDTVEFTGM